MSSRTFHAAAGSQSWFEHAEERIDADVQTAAETGAPLAALFDSVNMSTPKACKIWVWGMMFSWRLNDYGISLLS